MLFFSFMSLSTCESLASKNSIPSMSLWPISIFPSNIWKEYFLFSKTSHSNSDSKIISPSSSNFSFSLYWNLTPSIESLKKSSEENYSISLLYRLNIKGPIFNVFFLIFFSFSASACFASSSFCFFFSSYFFFFSSSCSSFSSFFKS